MRNHLLIIRQRCNFCRMHFGIVEKFNAMVSPNNRIRIIDTTDEQYYGVDFNPIAKMVDWDGTPTLYMDGIVLEGATTKHYIEGFLRAYFEGIGEKI